MLPSITRVPLYCHGGRSTGALGRESHRIIGLRFGDAEHKAETLVNNLGARLDINSQSNALTA